MRFICVFLLSTLCFYFLNSCERDDYLSLPDSAEGFAPVYLSFEDFKIGLSPSPSSKNNSFSFSNMYKGYYFHIENNIGVHIQKMDEDTNLYFIEIPLAEKVFNEGDTSIYIQTDYGLIHFNIENLPAISFTEVSHPYNHEFWNSRAFYQMADPFPASAKILKERYYMECPDSSKGYVLKWEEKTLAKPECFKKL